MSGLYVPFLQAQQLLQQHFQLPTPEEQPEFVENYYAANEPLVVTLQPTLDDNPEAWAAGRDPRLEAALANPAAITLGGRQQGEDKHAADEAKHFYEQQQHQQMKMEKQQMHQQMQQAKLQAHEDRHLHEQQQQMQQQRLQQQAAAAAAARGVAQQESWVPIQQQLEQQKQQLQEVEELPVLVVEESVPLVYVDDQQPYATAVYESEVWGPGMVDPALQERAALEAQEEALATAAFLQDIGFTEFLGPTGDVAAPAAVAPAAEALADHSPATEVWRAH